MSLLASRYCTKTLQVSGLHSKYDLTHPLIYFIQVEQFASQTVWHYWSVSGCVWHLSIQNWKNFSCAFAKRRRATVSLVMSACLSIRLCSWNNAARNGRIFMIFDIRVFFKTLSKIKISLTSYKNNGYFTWKSIHILIISRSIPLTMSNISDKICSENQNTHSVFNNVLHKIVRFMRQCGKLQ
jgi:hypothetical protein